MPNGMYVAHIVLVAWVHPSAPLSLHCRFLCWSSQPYSFRSLDGNTDLLRRMKKVQNTANTFTRIHLPPFQNHSSFFIAIFFKPNPLLNSIALHLFTKENTDPRSYLQAFKEPGVERCCIVVSGNGSCLLYTSPSPRD